jgi:hypothetical protein
MKGYVYLFKKTGTNIYKIGMTQTESVSDRFTSFKTYSETPVEIVSVVETENPPFLEKKLHTQFSEKRLNGEFFRLDDIDVMLFKDYETYETKLLNDFFWKYVLTKKINIENLKKAISFMEVKESKVSDLEIDVVNYINENLLNYEMTNSEINVFLKEAGIICNSKQLGVILKKRYEQKIKNIEGRNSRIYLLC